MVYDANNLTISGFTIQNSGGLLMQGLLIWYAPNIEVFDNIFRYNYIGINIKSYSSENKIYHNYFIDNNYNAINNCAESENQWDNDYPSGGNYWDDYTGVDNYQGPNQNISGSDGMGDTPYTMQGSDACQDRFPLMESPATPNNPPNTPTNPNPSNHVTNIAINADLTWSCTDPDGDPLTYDIYFGTSSPPSFSKTIGPYPASQTSLSYNPGTMNYNTTYFWKVVAWDNHDTSTPGSIWDFTTGNEPNEPPYTPSNPNPSNHVTNIAINADLSWTGGDPDSGDTISYDVYFGTTNPPSQVASNQSGTTYEPGTLNYNTKYYWKIVAWDNHDTSTPGSIWDFTTKVNNPPNPPRNPNPVNHNTSVDINADLSWLGGDPDSGDTVSYDIYFGTTNPPSQVASNQSGTTYEPGTLNYNTTYFWKVVAWDNHDTSTTGPIWDFTTGNEPNEPPNTPSNPNPVNNTEGIALNTNLNWAGGDPDSSDTVSYDIYFDTSKPPVSKLATIGPYPASQTSISYTPPQDTMNSNTTYYWKIVAKDNHEASTTGPVWDFTTVYVKQPPYTPYNPTPQNGKTSINIDQDLYWSGGDPNSGDTVTYDVYFGTTNPPAKKISNQSATSYDPGTMNYNTKYYWRIVAWDNYGESSTGPIWSFTTVEQSQGGNGGNGGNGGGDGGGSFLPPNIIPIANASASDNSGFVNTAVTFNASYSVDEDGEITNYTWDFGDNSYGYGILTTHTYEKTGTYNVKLTVTDNNDISDTDSFKVIISQPNSPPTIPQIDGPKIGKQNIEYNFTVFSTDPDNDNIQYTFTWDDDQVNETDFFANGTTYIQKHKWTSPGIYKIKVFAIDSNYAVSPAAEHTILIDVYYCKDIGYFIDENSDKIYDTFYSNTTGLLTDLVFEGGDYLIDTDGDGIENYFFNLENNALTQIETPGKDETPYDENVMLYLIALLIIVILIIIIIIARRPKDKVEDKKEKEKKEKKKKTDSNHKEKVDKIDKLIKNKEKDKVPKSEKKKSKT